MENFYTVSFYVLAFICVVCGIYCLFENNIKRSVNGVIVFFIATALLIWLLGAPLAAILEVIIFAIGAGFLLKTTAALTEGDPSKSLTFGFKTLFAPFLGIIFIAMLTPFILLTFSSFTSLGAHGFFDVLGALFKNRIFQITVLLIFIITVITGTISVLNIKNTCKKIKGLKTIVKDSNEEC